MNESFDAVINLGGGRNPTDGSLNPLSISRLTSCAEVVNSSQANFVIVMGGILKSHTPDSGYFKDYGADLREFYLTNNLLIPQHRIIKVRAECRDTISEAFEARKVLYREEFKKVLLCTTATHMLRALFIFRTICPSDIQIEPIPNPNQDNLNPDQEAELLKLTQDLFANIGPIDHNMTWEKWYAAHKDFYEAQRAIHKRFKESEMKVDKLIHLYFDRLNLSPSKTSFVLSQSYLV